MGSRGSFVNVEKGDFSFVEDGKKYEAMGEIAGVKIIKKWTACKRPDIFTLAKPNLRRPTKR